MDSVSRMQQTKWKVVVVIMDIQNLFVFNLLMHVVGIFDCLDD